MRFELNSPRRVVGSLGRTRRNLVVAPVSVIPLLLVSIAGIDWLHWVFRVISVVLWLALPVGAWLNSRHRVTASNRAAFALSVAAVAIFVGSRLYDARQPFDDGFLPGAGYVLAILLMVVGALTSDPGSEWLMKDSRTPL